MRITPMPRARLLVLAVPLVAVLAATLASPARAATTPEIRQSLLTTAQAGRAAGVTGSATVAGGSCSGTICDRDWRGAPFTTFSVMIYVGETPANALAAIATTKKDMAQHDPTYLVSTRSRLVGVGTIENIYFGFASNADGKILSQAVCTTQSGASSNKEAAAACARRLMTAQATKAASLR